MSELFDSIDPDRPMDPDPLPAQADGLGGPARRLVRDADTDP